MLLGRKCNKPECYSHESVRLGFTMHCVLCAEPQTPISAGSYLNKFQYDAAIGWQTTVVGVIASDNTVYTNNYIFASQPYELE